jgi:hypothetical protein
LTQETFLSRAVEAHGDAYDYSQALYHAAHEKLAIGCKAHGLFWQTPHNHVDAKNGCPSCVSHYSAGHREVDDFLKSLGEETLNNVRTVIPPFELDTFLPKRNLAIEYNGEFWHSVPREDHPARFRHRDKFNRCLRQGIQLFQINAHEWANPSTRAVWKSILQSKLSKHERIPARETSFREIPSRVANDFLSCSHLQGVTSATKWCFGLFLGGGLVAVMTFSGHQKTALNLSRMAFPLNTTVVGGAKKLFQNALPLLPPRDIVTFANHRYSQGSVYVVLGFKPDNVLPPSYQWYFKGRVLDKRQCRHAKLPSLLGNGYDPMLTEHENMFRAGARCLYDAGYQRWVFERVVSRAPSSRFEQLSAQQLVV